MIARLLTVAPDADPVEVQERQEEAVRKRAGRGARLGLVVYLAWLALVPVGLANGVRDVPTFVAMVALTVGAAAVAFKIVWTRQSSAVSSLLLYVFTLAAIATLSGLFGALVLVPGMATATATFFSLSNSLKRGRAIILAFALLSIAVPFGLEVLGLTPTHYVFDQGRLCIHPVLLNFSPGPTLLLLGLSGLVVLIASVLFVSRYRLALTEAERRSMLQAWHLEQMVPAGAREAMAAPQEGGVRAQLASLVEALRTGR